MVASPPEIRIMFNRTIGVILLIAVAAGAGLLAAQKFFGPASPA